jgi:6-phosphogluconate dehydrogenase
MPSDTAPQSAQIGLVGLAVMGQNLVLNMIDHGARVAVYNRTTATTDAFLAGTGADAAARGALRGATTLDELVDALERPRRVMIMVKAGRAVDAVIDALVPLLDPGDVVIDGGNSHLRGHRPPRRAARGEGAALPRRRRLRRRGGGALRPAIMPGGPRDAYATVRPLFEAIAAQVDGVPCCDWMGEDGAGHFVKMVHNGIEYGDMQLIAEAYHLMRDALGMPAPPCTRRSPAGTRACSTPT